MRESPGADFWRLQLDDGEFRDMTVASSKQSGAVSAVRNGLDIRYDRLVAEDGNAYPVTFVVRVRAVDGNLQFSYTNNNNSEARVNEVKLPFYVQPLHPRREKRLQAATEFRVCLRLPV